ncbi:MAG TPA: glycosyltransferase family 39 protein [Polyangiaceae bacterium]|nr:glycosyltransferase family 39 protein [Polyangiaceae bacterium]
MRSRAPFVLLALVAVYQASALVWLLRHVPTLPPDALDYAEVARSVIRGQGDTVNHVVFHTGFFRAVRHPLEVHGLLTPWLLVPLFKIWGATTAVARVPSAFAFAAVGTSAFLVAARFEGVVAGVLAGALCVTRYDLEAYAGMGTDDLGLAALALGAVGCFSLGVAENSRRWFGWCGLLAGAAAAQKVSGLLLPEAFTLTLLLVKEARSRAGLRGWFWIVGPTLAVIVLYAIRNERVYGELGSPYGALEWLGKEHLSRYFGLYEAPLRTTEILRTAGAPHVLELVGRQFRTLWEVVGHDPLVLMGLLATLAELRVRPAFAVATLSYVLGLVFLLCVLHHVEARYLAALVPLCAVSSATAAARVLARASSRWPEAIRWAERVGSAGVAGYCLWNAVSFTRELRSAGAMAASGICAGAMDFVRDALPADAVVLTPQPWLLSWAGERAAVNAPTNGLEAVVKVATHYRTGWAFADASFSKGFDMDGALATPEIADALNPSTVYTDGSCSVYRLEGIQ